MKVFLTCYGGAHIAAIAPLVHNLNQRGHQCTLLALTTAGLVAQREQLGPCRPIDYVDSSNPAIYLPGVKLAKKHHTEGKGISLEESIAYLGVSFRDLATELGIDDAWKRYHEFGLNAFTPVRFMRDVLSRIQPDVVVATTSPRMEKAALRAAYQLDIPSLCMIELFGILEEPWLGRPDNGHVLAVSREDVIRRLCAAGRQREDIYLIGSPMFDQLADPALPSKGKRWRQERQIADHEKLVFWAEQPEPDNPQLPRIMRKHLAEVCKRNGWRFVVRLHPSSTDPRWEVLPDDCIQSHSDEPLAQLIHACDVGITLTSTVGWEILLSDKPLLVPRLSSYSRFVTYGDGDGALAVDSIENIEAGLKTLLDDSKISQELRAVRAALPQPGGAAERVADLIENIVFPRSYSLEKQFVRRHHAK